MSPWRISALGSGAFSFVGGVGGGSGRGVVLVDDAGKTGFPPAPLPQSDDWKSLGINNSYGRSESGLSSDASYLSDVTVAHQRLGTSSAFSFVGGVGGGSGRGFVLVFLYGLLDELGGAALSDLAVGGQGQGLDEAGDGGSEEGSPESEELGSRD